MKKRFMRMVVLVLILSMAILPATMAAEARASYYIDNCNARIAATGNGNLRINFNITGTGLMTNIGATRIDVKNSNGLTVKTFFSANSLYSNMMGSNAYYHLSSVTYAGTSGSYYYAVVTFYAGNSTGSDTDVYMTASVMA
ncbi:MAG: hypothetical protein LBK69_00790 [Syntrophomonadaceae bacterium]|nr:hypothetical protein [Syntrophomonadaceae bacterium]